MGRRASSTSASSSSSYGRVSTVISKSRFEPKKTAIYRAAKAAAIKKLYPNTEGTSERLVDRSQPMSKRKRNSESAGKYREICNATLMELVLKVQSLEEENKALKVRLAARETEIKPEKNMQPLLTTMLEQVTGLLRMTNDIGSTALQIKALGQSRTAMTVEEDGASDSLSSPISSSGVTESNVSQGGIPQQDRFSNFKL